MTAPAAPGPLPHPITLPWRGGPYRMYSWEVACPGGSGCGIAATEELAVRVVTELLAERGGHGIVQVCSLGPSAGGGTRSQYAYGEVVGRASGFGGTVRWAGRHPPE